jgi:multicomponent Na+:H+ antiporter subunit C
MNGLLTAVVAAFLFASGTYLVLSREPIKLVLGLSIISYGVNLLLFTASTLRRGLPPIIENKEAFNGEIAQYVDPIPQALILTAIVISFGIVAFLLVLLNRRNTLTETYLSETPPEITEIVNDPFGTQAHFISELDADPDDYEWLEDTLEETLANRARQQESG